MTIEKATIMHNKYQINMQMFSKEMNMHHS